MTCDEATDWALVDKYIPGCISIPTEIKRDVIAVLLGIAGGWSLNLMLGCENTQRKASPLFYGGVVDISGFLMASSINQKRLNRSQAGCPEHKLRSHAAKTRRHVQRRQ